MSEGKGDAKGKRLGLKGESDGEVRHVGLS